MLEFGDERKFQRISKVDGFDRNGNVGREVVLQSDTLRQRRQQQFRYGHVMILTVEMIERALQLERNTFEVLSATLGVRLSQLCKCDVDPTRKVQLATARKSQHAFFFVER